MSLSGPRRLLKSITRDKGSNRRAGLGGEKQLFENEKAKQYTLVITAFGTQIQGQPELHSEWF